MARVSRRGTMQRIQNNPVETEYYRTAIYVRLSNEDDDCDSLENQMALLQEYVGRQADMRYVATFADNGFSGTNFERPEFNKMMDAVRNEDINCIVVKDLSRLGRNYIETGDYIEKIFPFLKVRFVAVNDRFDTKNGYDASALIVPIKNMVNEVYAKDISKKIISTFRAKQKRGEFIGLAAPFGYAKDPSDKNHFVVDHKAADIVRRIYRMRMNGMGAGRITKQLNTEGISCPRRYRYEHGLASSDRYKNARWNDSTVKRILESEVYIGHTVQGKQRQELCNNIRKYRPDRSEWFVAENTHEPIIEKKLFDKVQKLMAEDAKRQKESVRQRFPKEEKEENILKGHMVCGGCGKALLLYQYISHGSVRRDYLCRVARHEGSDACPNSSYADKHAVEESVLLAIKNGILKLQDILNDRKIGNSHGERSVVQMERDARKIREKLGNLYEDHVQGIVDSEEYELLKSSYLKALEETEVLIKAEKAAEEDNNNVMTVKERLDLYRQAENLTKELVDTFLDRVVVYERDRMEIILSGADVIFTKLKGDR